MREVCTFSVLGGDVRQLYLSRFLNKKGFKVKNFALGEKHGDLYDAVKDANYVVLPLPLSRDGVYLNAPLTEDRILLSEIYSVIPEKTKVFAGMIRENEEKLMRSRNFDYYDYYKSEKLILKNAVVTAEGIIQTIMEETPVTVSDSSFGITGYGRVSKLLAKNLKSLGGVVTIVARNPNDRLWAETEGYNAVPFNELSKIADSFDCFINTVPSNVISGEIMRRYKKECLLIETASAPGGFSEITGEKPRLINTGSLPGKTSPKTAGEIIGLVILELLKGERE